MPGQDHRRDSTPGVSLRTRVPSTLQTMFTRLYLSCRFMKKNYRNLTNFEWHLTSTTNLRHVFADHLLFRYTSKSKKDNQSPVSPCSLSWRSSNPLPFVHQRDPWSPQTSAPPHQFLAMKVADPVTKQRVEKCSDLADWGEGVQPGEEKALETLQQPSSTWRGLQEGAFLQGSVVTGQRIMALNWKRVD